VRLTFFDFSNRIFVLIVKKTRHFSILFSVHDGVFRQYTGERSLRNLKKYIDNQEWQKTLPVSSYFGPNSILYVNSFTSFFFIQKLFHSDHTACHLPVHCSVHPILSRFVCKEKNKNTSQNN
jgi:hypothetical protein